MFSRHRIKWWFTHINNKAFGGKLPPLCQFKFGKDDSALGSSWIRDFFDNPECKGKPVHTQSCIAIHRKMFWATNLVLMVLVHEMVHLAHPTWHDCSKRRFENEVLRVKRKVLPKWVLH